MGGEAPPCTEGHLKVSGRVTSPTGVALGGVTLALSGAGSAQTTTNLNGDYSIEGLCPGSYRLVPSYEGLLFCDESATYESLEHDAAADFTGSLDGCDKAPIERRVLALVYDPTVAADGDTPRRLSVQRGWADPESTLASYVRAVEHVTNGHVRYQVTQRPLDKFPDFLGYDEQQYLACLEDPALCHEPQAADHDSIILDQEICKALEDGTADEIWLAGGPHFGFSPWLLFSGCRRSADVAGFDYSRGLAGMFEGLHARSEATLTSVFGADPASLFGQFRRIAIYPASGDVSGCGTASTAPNGSAEHPFDNPEPVTSYCDVYYGDPSSEAPPPSVQPVSCEAWGCSELGYRQYWFRHLPKASGVDGEGRLLDWWRYVLNPEERRTLGDVSCSATYQDDWCSHVNDGVFGDCNDREWALPTRPTGWVEFHWRTERPVHRVRIYDRACMERVERGHLEFSDGSEPIYFGPLDNSGMTPAIVTFDQKLLSGLRVYIDESDGTNPGFGEIVID